MQLTEKNITDFQRIYRERFGRNISRAQTIEQGTALMQVVQAIYKPISRNEHEEFTRRRKEKYHD